MEYYRPFKKKAISFNISRNLIIRKYLYLINNLPKISLLPLNLILKLLLKIPKSLKAWPGLL